MSVDVTKQRGTSRKSLASFLLAVACLGSAEWNTRPTTEVGSSITLVAGLLSLILAVLGIKDVWQSRGGLHGVSLAITGAGLAVLGMLTSQAYRAGQEADFRRTLVTNNVKVVAAMLLEYEKEHGTLPPAATYTKDGRPLLSWRVLLLPYLEREDLAERGLFQQFRLEEPWDSPHNLRLLGRIPKVYAPPEGITAPGPSVTYYRVFVGKGAAFEGGEGVRLADFPDGTDKTVLVAEAGEAVPWTKPEDLPYAPDRPLPKLGFLSQHRFTVAMTDGSVRSVRTDIREENLRAAVTRNGGEPLGPDW